MNLFHPYENIFEGITPLNFCVGMIVLICVIFVLQMIGSKAGNDESSLLMNVYLALSMIAMMVVIMQWVYIVDKYEHF